MIKTCDLVMRNDGSAWCNDCLRVHAGHTIKIALGTTPEDEAYRRLWRGLPQVTNPVSHNCSDSPNVFKRITNYAVSLASHVVDGLQKAANDELLHRQSKCATCMYNKDGSCMLCGCPLSGTIIGDKLAWASSKCWNWEKAGVAIGCFNLPKLAELQIVSIGKLCGPTPILICDDSVPGSDKQKAHEQLARKYPNVTYWPNPENYGHHRGDASCYWKAIQWGNMNKLDVVCKLSMRHLFTHSNWLKNAAEPFLVSGEATGAVNCIDNNTRLYIRSEAALLNVRKWFDSGAWKDLQGRNSYAPVVELHYNHIICKYFGDMEWTDEKGKDKIGRRWIWPALRERRYEKQDGILWHCANTEEEYRNYAKQFGMELDHDFHVNGSEQRTGYTKGYKIG